MNLYSEKWILVVVLCVGVVRAALVLRQKGEIYWGEKRAFALTRFPCTPFQNYSFSSVAYAALYRTLCIPDFRVAFVFFEERKAFVLLYMFIEHILCTYNPDD